MNRRTACFVCFIVLALVASALAAAGAPAAEAPDARLAAAEKFVRASDRYLHHSRIRRGMKGYGLTVMAGTEIVRFDVEIVSVVTNWSPHRDVILARLSGLDLATTGIIAGMSGSPVFIPHEGGDRLIGAVAYGWSAQKTPQCGIQPISQMLAVGGIVPGQPAPAGKPAEARGGPRGRETPEFLAAVLNPGKPDFSTFAWPSRPIENIAAPRLVRLTTPLMVSALSPRAFAALSDCLSPMGIVPVQSGGVGSVEVQAAAKDAKLQPGSGVSVPLVMGDADLAAAGTVTEVLGDKILAFGHPFFAEGDVSFPMGPAYIHTVIASVIRSFKLSSTLKITGALTRDESTGVFGVRGRKVDMIPMVVRVHWTQDNHRSVFRYRLAKHYWLTPLLAGIMVKNSVWAWHDLPKLHTVRHRVDIDFGKLGRYRAANIFSGRDVMPAASDAVRPLAALLNNPLAPPPEVRSISVDITVEPGQKTAKITRFNLDGPVYRPGETVTGKVMLRPFRKPRFELPVRFKLPDDLPDGTYKLTACNYTTHLGLLRKEMPQRFDARTLPELFRAIQRVVEPGAARLYLRLPLGRGGLSLDRREMPDLPESKARIIREARPGDTHTFAQTLVRSPASEYVLSGSAQAVFRVEEHPKETQLREKRK